MCIYASVCLCNEKFSLRHQCHHYFPKCWFCQGNLLAADIISAIEFESRGEYLATGDCGGRVVLFERTNGKDVSFIIRLLTVCASMHTFEIYYMLQIPLWLFFVHSEILNGNLPYSLDSWNIYQLPPRKVLENMDYHTPVHPKYIYKTEFQSHEPEVCICISFTIQLNIDIYQITVWNVLMCAL